MPLLSFNIGTDRQQIDRLEQKLDWLRQYIAQQGARMDQQISDLAKKLDDATNAIASRIQRLLDIANKQGTVTSAEVARELQPVIDKLTALGQDPADPVPANTLTP